MLGDHAATHHVDKSRQEHQGDGEHPNQGAVHLGPHDLPGQSLQRGGEELGWGWGVEREGGRDGIAFSKDSTNGPGSVVDLPVSLPSMTPGAFLVALPACKSPALNCCNTASRSTAGQILQLTRSRTM